ncbi:MAG: hypothetical protein E7388_08255 [Ruminococcaceae bacterium]|nr:hypothetical protein [Oscillospiraceae bacterium]
MEYINNLTVEGFKGGHVQGIAIDKSREYMYFSFTTCLVKTDMKGNIIGTVEGLVGHLGCIAYNYDDGKVYGSLEFKNDCIGAGILAGLGLETKPEEGFYMTIFDVDKINCPGMDAEKDGVMKAVYLKEVCDDYLADGHRYGCSGIDGTTFAPDPGNLHGKMYLHVAYGIYGDVNRDDNDNQIILKYDVGNWDKYAKPLNQNAMHKSGPEKPDYKYFVYTGNTVYGIQNLEYDPYTDTMFAAVYRGEKPQFPNYTMFHINWSSDKKNIPGSFFPYGATGMISLGDGYFYFSRDFKNEKGYGTNVQLYKYENGNFTEVLQ